MTARRRFAAVALVALVALAGCNALGTAGESGGDTPGPVTPAPVGPAGPVGPSPAPADGERGDPVSADGPFAALLENGTLDLEAVVAGHVRYLSNRSFTLVSSHRIRGGDEAADGRSTERVAVVNDSAYGRRITDWRSGTNRSTYVAPGGQYRRVDAADTPPVVELADDVVADPGEHFAGEVGGLVGQRLVGDSLTLGVVDRNGTRYLRAFSRQAPLNFGAVYESYQVFDFTATLWVAPEGYVRAFHYGFELVSGTRRVAVDHRFAFTAVGETTLPDPAWVDAARLNVTDTPYGTDNGTEAGPRSRRHPSLRAAGPPQAARAPQAARPA